MSGGNAIIAILKAAAVIPDRYTGQVVLHVGEGNLCNVEPRERPHGTEHFDRLQALNENILLTNLSGCGNQVGN